MEFESIVQSILNESKIDQQPLKRVRTENDLTIFSTLPNYICSSSFKLNVIEIVTGLSLENFEPKYCIINEKRSSFVEYSAETFQNLLKHVFELMRTEDKRKRNRSIFVVNGPKIQQYERKGIRKILLQDLEKKTRISLNVFDIDRLSEVDGLIIESVTTLENIRYSVKNFYMYYLRANYCKLSGEKFSLPLNDINLNYSKLAKEFEIYLKPRFEQDLLSRRFVITARDIIQEIQNSS